MKKRIIAFLLTITLLLSVFNTGIVVSSAEVDTDVVITVLDSNGNNIDNSALSVSVTCTYRRGVFGTTRTENRTVTNFGGGVFGYDYSSQSNIQYYTINATLKDGSRTYTASEQVAKNADSVVITLSDYVQEDTWETFDVYYIADGHFPESFYGYGEQEDYGPAGDDTPLLRINVNITRFYSVSQLKKKTRKSVLRYPAFVEFEFSFRTWRKHKFSSSNLKNQHCSRSNHT